MKRFPNQTVIITGASEGVGLACAEEFYAEGPNAVLVARRTASLLEAAARFQDDRVGVHQDDVPDEES